MSPLPACWRLLVADRVALHDLREELQAATARGVAVFVDVLETDVSRSVAASPRCADPEAATYRVGERIFVRGGSDEELLEQLRRGLELLESAHAR